MNTPISKFPWQGKFLTKVEINRYLCEQANFGVDDLYISICAVLLA